MIETHTIRLRGPWECAVNGGRPRRLHMPAPLSEVADVTDQGRLLCRRRFGCPTCLDPHEQVWLVIDRPALLGDAHLNGAPLGPIRAAEDTSSFDITTRLVEHNQLVLDFDLSASAADALLFADVRLEIRG